MSEVVKTMITDDDDSDEIQEIPLPNVKSTILSKVIEFAKHYKEEAMTEIEKVKFTVFIFSCIFDYFFFQTNIID
jgi:S-phase kinase-associated protein 1